MPIRALYVDDEPGLLEIVKLFLEQAGEIAVDCAACADEAEQRMIMNEYDVIISDYQMAGANGIELLDHLRSKRCTVPFILFTGLEREDIAIDVLILRAGFYLQKMGPFAALFANLEFCIRAVVHRHRAEMTGREGEDCFHRLVNDPFNEMGAHIDMVPSKRAWPSA